MGYASHYSISLKFANLESDDYNIYSTCNIQDFIYYHVIIAKLYAKNITVLYYVSLTIKKKTLNRSDAPSTINGKNQSEHIFKILIKIGSVT